MIAFALRPGARLRLLVRAAGDAAVRRLAPADVAAGVQRRRRARSAPRARRPGAGAAAAVPLRRRRAHRHDHPLGDRRAHGVALDDRARELTVALRVAVDDRRGSGGSLEMADGPGDRRRVPSGSCW